MPDHHPASIGPLASLPGAATLPERVRGVLGQLQELLASELTPELDRLLVTLEDEVFANARLARNPALQSGFLETVRLLQVHRNEFAPAFLTGLQEALVGIRDRRAESPGPELAPSVDTMRLVAHNEVDEDSELNSIALRHEARAGLPLMLLGQRFGVLAGAPAFEPAALPVGPRNLGRLLARACDVLQVNKPTRVQLYGLFDHQLMSGYEGLVEKMNGVMDAANVLPGLTFVPLRPRRRSAAADATHAASPHDAPATPHGAGSGDAPRSYTAWAGEPGQAAQTGQAGESETLALLRQLLAERRHLIDQLANTNQTPRIALATADVDAALSSLQARPATSQSQRSVGDIRQALLAQSRLQLGHAATLSREDGDTFELLGLLYAELGRELRQGAPSTALLDRLKVPLLRVALQDQGFFVRQQHPARQLLDAVAEAGAVWQADDDADPQFAAQLQSAVDHVVTHYDGDDAVFESANQQLQKHLQGMVRKAEVSERRHVEAARGRDKLELAKQRAGDTVTRAVGSGSVPKFLRTLLDQAWTDVLTLVLLRHGEDSKEWREHVQATSQIIAATVQGQSPPPDLAPRIEQSLGLVGYHGEDALAIVRSLTGAGDDSDDPASRTELAIKIKSRARLGADTAPKSPPPPPRSPREQECYEHLRSLPFGTWLEFSINQQGDVVRRRLAWFSPRTGHALFVNQRGHRVDDGRGELNLDRVARLFAADQVRVVTADRGRLIDRAWKGALKALSNFGTPSSKEREA